MDDSLFALFDTQSFWAAFGRRVSISLGCLVLLFIILGVGGRILEYFHPTATDKQDKEKKP